MAGELSHNESLGLLKDISNLYLDISSEHVEGFQRYNGKVTSHPEMAEVRDLHLEYHQLGISSLTVAFESVFAQVEFENEIFELLIPKCSEINRVQIKAKVSEGVYGTAPLSVVRSFDPETPWGGRVSDIDVIRRIDEKVLEIRKAEEFLSTPALYGTSNHFLKAGLDAQIKSLKMSIHHDISKILCRRLISDELQFFLSLRPSNFCSLLKLLSDAAATLDQTEPFKRYIVFPVTLRGKVVPDSVLDLLRLVEVY